jgi:hypothetical protein
LHIAGLSLSLPTSALISRMAIGLLVSISLCYISAWVLGF